MALDEELPSSLVSDSPPHSLTNHTVCLETLSHVDWYSNPRFQAFPDLSYPVDDHDYVWNAQFQSQTAAQMHDFDLPVDDQGPLPPETAFVFPPAKTILREGRRDVQLGRPRAHPGPIPHLGAGVPHSGPLKLNTPIIGHSGPLKSAAKSTSGPSIIPADIIGKKKPPGYDGADPTSPEVTCLGRVRIKRCKDRKETGKSGDRKQLNDLKSKFIRKKGPPDGTKEATEPEAAAVDKTDMDIDLGRFASACGLSTTFTDQAAHADNQGDQSEISLQRCDEELYEPPLPPANSLLLMRGSRNVERNHLHSRNVQRNNDWCWETDAQTGDGILLPEMHSSRPQESLPEAKIWQRRAVVGRLCALDVRKF